MADLDLRGKLLFSNPFRCEDVTIDVGGEIGELRVRVRAPSIEQRNRILAEAREQDGAGLTRAQAMAVVLCCRSPDGEALIFSEDDVKGLMELPAGGWVDELANRVMSLINTGVEAAKK